MKLDCIVFLRYCLPVGPQVNCFYMLHLSRRQSCLPFSHCCHGFDILGQLIIDAHARASTQQLKAIFKHVTHNYNVKPKTL